MFRLGLLFDNVLDRRLRRLFGRRFVRFSNRFRRGAGRRFFGNRSFRL
jgi:hypothetical protein